MDTQTNPCPANIKTACDYLQHAQAQLQAEIWRYLQEGAGNGAGTRANVNALASIRIMPRPLADVRGGHTRIRLFGEELAQPILLGPVAYQRLFHPDGESASAMAAAAHDGQLVVSSLASQPLTTIVKAAKKPLWFQLYWQGNRERSLQLAQRALAAGYTTLMLTVDAPVKQASIQLPPQVTAVNLDPALSSPEFTEGQSVVFNGWMAQAPSWTDFEWLRQQLPCPLLVKGILHPADAERAISIGCDGVVVSNHGGRVLEAAPPAIEALQTVATAVASRVPVLFDSGIRNGGDVFKALALGADAVMLGRPYIWGLSVAGAMGVSQVIRLLRDELEMTMALAGCATIKDITAETLSLNTEPWLSNA
ncbi:MAG TPA: alpha-hydroxy acid oxidase [Pseudomonadales bacterium]|nr:alpha-hydroxy acid oxidase [Pseudomonadales bacterium]